MALMVGGVGKKKGKNWVLFGGYQVRFIPSSPVVERPGTVWTNDSKKTFHKGLAIPKHAMVTSKCINHFVPSD